MKNLLIFFILCSCIWDEIHAQLEEPQMLLEFRFEDRMGNRDTIWMGMDTDASSDDINPQFGEEEITEPWDSVFEVRAVHGGIDVSLADPLSYKPSKIVVDRASDADTLTRYFLFFGAQMMIYAKYPPVTMSWDGDYIENQNLDEFSQLNTYIAPSQATLVTEDWWNWGPIFCLYGRDQYTYDPYEYVSTWEFVRPGLVEGRDTLVDIPMMMLHTITGPPNACSELITSSESEHRELEFQIYPNPVVDRLYVQSEDIASGRISVLNLQGQLMYEGMLDDGQNMFVEVGDWIPGVYWVRVITADGRYAVQPFVKM